METTASGTPLVKGVIQTGSTTHTEFRPAPLPPEWIRDGNPVARSLPLASADDQHLSCGLWDCQAGKFTYVYPCDEIVHILEGEVTVEEPGATHTLRAGDVALFRQGLQTVWTVPQYVRKFAIFRLVRETATEKFIRRSKKLMRMIQGKPVALLMAILFLEMEAA